MKRLHRSNHPEADGHGSRAVEFESFSVSPTVTMTAADLKILIIETKTRNVRFGRILERNRQICHIRGLLHGIE